MVSCWAVDADLTPEERLEAYWRLVRRAWIASGRELPTSMPRSLLPRVQGITGRL
jgi:hypothetical protein